MGLIVGVTGRGRHGKDEIASVLQKTYGFKRLSFAAAVKDFAVKHFGLSYDEAYVNRTPTSRHILQSIGNGCREEFGKDIWINKLFSKIKDTAQDVVISDCRYINEAAKIQDRGGFIIRVLRPNAPKIEAGTHHLSETEMDQIIPDITIVNDGSLEELQWKVAEAYTLLLKLEKTERP